MLAGWKRCVPRRGFILSWRRARHERLLLVSHRMVACLLWESNRRRLSGGRLIGASCGDFHLDVQGKMTDD